MPLIVHGVQYIPSSLSESCMKYCMSIQAPSSKSSSWETETMTLLHWTRLTLLDRGMPHKPCSIQVCRTCQLLSWMLCHGILPWGKMPQFALDFTPFVGNSKNLLCPSYLSIASGGKWPFLPQHWLCGSMDGKGIYGRKKDYLDEKVTNEDDFFC
jgi:hypothetical protein